MSPRGRASRPARPGRPSGARAQGGGAKGGGAKGAGAKAGGVRRPASARSTVEPAAASAPREPFRLTYVEGATPARWIRAWGERMPQPLEHERVALEQQLDALRAGDADAAIVRLPIDEGGLHVVRLYDERAFVVVPREHPLADAESAVVADLDDASTIARGTMTWQELVEVVASGAGVAVMPQSLARLHHRRDVAAVPVADLPPTTIALVWQQERDADDVQALVAITRGRSARSSR
ncbi:LysR family transcriptional regulator substrate-binding protein [Agrococcus sp. SGAir0287]|uniref:LysR family transcriptional regulator substrate-binding protein n=1 Tax=Agrococcus sp. SGAir0287 TaxID=2070347 RepID=UPI0010CCC6A9|nr:LysR family transcriptional regulator substrate-binding protein [Agrococcus sp. SGAir0287]QCR20125.1 LysR family transcriptional regulator [Agrococcus sp. SGAir0287]